VVINGQELGQSTAINFYFASEHNLMGKNNFEAACIVSIAEHLREMNAAYSALVPAGTQPTKQALDTWFEGGANDVHGHAIEETSSQRYLTWWMGRIERVVGPGGTAVGDRLSLADLLLYNTFAETETLRDEGIAEGGGQWRRGPMGDQARLEGMLSRHPKIKACCAHVAGLPGIQRLLALKDT
jgi:glutathione S-transferase